MKKKVTFICIIVSCVVAFVACNNVARNEKSYLQDMKVESLWEYSKGENQTIAFIDTGITKEEYEFYKDRVVTPSNVLDESTNVSDAVGHGTEIISIACGDGQKGIVGIAPKSKIMPIKAIGNDGHVDAKTIVKGIQYAIDKNATIINLSFGSHIEDTNVKNVIEEALHKNITVVAAAGDYSQKDLLFSASMQDVISVEALDEKGQLWELSNTSENNISTFPGVNILALSLNNKEKTVRGTSYSCALASGYVAVMRAYLEKMKIDIVNDKIIKQISLINVAKTGRLGYIQPIEDFNYHSFINKFKFIIQNSPNPLIPLFCVSAFLLIRFL